MPYNDVAKNAFLTGGLDITHVGVHTLVDPGTGTTANAGEASGGSYARQACSLATAAGGARASSGALVIPVPAGTYGFLTYWNAATGNTTQYRGHSPMGGTNNLRGFFSAESLASDNLSSRAHGLSNGDRIQLFNVFAESLPTGLTEGTIYYVVGAATDAFQVSTTLGGSAVDVTAMAGGEGFWQRIVPETYNTAGEITVAIGAIVHDLTAV